MSTTWKLLAAVALLILLALLTVPAFADWDPDRELEEIREQIERNGEHWIAGHTEVSDLPPDVKARMLGARFDKEQWLSMSTGTIPPAEPRDLPSSLDWRELGGMTPAKNQGGCGSCWCFGPTAALESMIKIYTGVETNLSEQQGLVCSNHPNGCGGGMAGYVCNVQMTMGQVTESCMPYTANDGTACVDDECDSVERIRGYTAVPNDEIALKTALMIGPLSVNLYAPNSLFWYNGGCFEYTGNNAINHCVCLCGWDDNACNGQGAWLIKNSWGGSWGENGFGWIRFGDCRLGNGAILIDYIPTTVRLAEYDVEVIDGNNGYADAGETVQLDVMLKNYGRVDATGITVYLSTATAGITILDPSASYPSIPVEGTSWSYEPHFTVQIAPGTAGVIQFDLSIQSDQAENQASSCPLMIGPIDQFYATGFESGTDGWTHGGTGDDWRRGTLERTYEGKPDPRAAARGQYCFGNDLNESGSWNTVYDPNIDCWLESPVIDCSGWTGVHLAFRRWLTVQRRPSDYARLYVNDVEVFINPFLVNSVEESWQEVIYDISEIADDNPNVRLKFTLKTSGNINYGGWNIDDVRLFVPAGIPGEVADFPYGMTALEVSTYPNPFRPNVHLRLSIPDPGGDAGVRVHDASGRLVRALELGTLPGGIHRTSWNGNDANGRRLPAGIYFLRVGLDGREVTSRVMMLQ
jgi:C1A family cysteine protease